ncbi:Predicted glycosyltransferase [Phaffia rhodozyma]|uniref:UDP-N-acetylglucosamine transferase subunit ALG14 n=1 Tax=Phaffia rhodozyma TaxID=264483 RepID=A0A0F7SL83_PHARH|nr:Predicted glycosyltransferase [Phaffia rhodozyma]
MLPWIVPLILLTPLVVFYRVWYILPRGYLPQPSSSRTKDVTNIKDKRSDKVVGVFLGSGGHTYEALKILDIMDAAKYAGRVYIYSAGDSMSLRKAMEFESSLASAEIPSHQLKKSNSLQAFLTIPLPRARQVGQSYVSSIFTTLHTIVHTLYHFTISTVIHSRRSSRKKPFADILILNGPGTATCLVLAVLTSRFLGLPSPRTIYIESFARTNSISLSGRILRPLVDRFLVQWPGALSPEKEGLPPGSKGECVGVVV